MTRVVIESSTTVDTTIDVKAEGSVVVKAEEIAGIYANTKLVSSSVTSNDGGYSIFTDGLSDIFAETNTAEQFTDEGVKSVKFGDRVKLSEDFGKQDFTTGNEIINEILTGQRVKTASDYLEATYDSDAGTRLLYEGDVIEVAPGYDASRGEPGESYRFIGSGQRGLRIDLSHEDYFDTSRWHKIGGENKTIYQYIGTTTEDINLNLQDYTNSKLWKKITGSAGEIYKYMGSYDSIDPASAECQSCQ